MVVGWLVLAALLAAYCTGPSGPATPFPSPSTLPTWTAASEPEVFDAQGMPVQATSLLAVYLGSRLETASVQTYVHRTGSELRVTVWEMATPADAYHLFMTTTCSEPGQMGSNGEREPEEHITFWQDRYFVEVAASPGQPHAILWELAASVSANLPHERE